MPHHRPFGSPAAGVGGAVAGHLRLLCSFNPAVGTRQGFAAPFASSPSARAGGTHNRRSETSQRVRFPYRMANLPRLHGAQIDWGHVGTLGYYAELLKRVTDSAFKEGECAE